MAMYSVNNNPHHPLGELSMDEESLDGFNEMFRVTCDIFKTFKGRSGKEIVAEVVPMINNSPELQQFIFELYYNTKVSSRLQQVYNDEK